jgi:hypothetical protein
MTARKIAMETGEVEKYWIVRGHVMERLKLITAVFVMPNHLMIVMQIVKVYGADLLFWMNVVYVMEMELVNVSMEVSAVNVVALQVKKGIVLEIVMVLQLLINAMSVLVIMLVLTVRARLMVMQQQIIVGYAMLTLQLTARKIAMETGEVMPY